MGAIPQLVKLQEELKDSGFAIVAAHVQNATKDELIGICRKNRVNYCVTSGGDAPGRGNGIPDAFLFDSTGKVIEHGHPVTMHKKIRDLVAAEPHFLAAGRSYTKLAAVAESLKKTKAYGQIIKKIDKDAKGDGPAAEEARYLSERIAAFGKRRLDEAKALEGEDPFRAQAAYAEVAACWKGAEAGTAAATRIKELKADKEFQTELKACQVLHQILAECEKLIVTGSTINLDYASNKKIAAAVRTGYAALKKKYPDSKATARAADALAPYGFKDLPR